MSTNKELTGIAKEISHGINMLRCELGFNSFYAMSKKLEFKSEATLKKVYEKGNPTPKTIEHIGRQLGYEGSGLSIVLRVLKKFEAYK